MIQILSRPMKHTRPFIWVTIMLTALISCTQEMNNAENDNIITAQGELSPKQFEQGFVRIYVASDLAYEIEAEGTSTFKTKSLSPLPGVKIERTFPFAGKFEARTHKSGLDRWYDVYFMEGFLLQSKTYDRSI